VLIVATVVLVGRGMHSSVGRVAELSSGRNQAQLMLAHAAVAVQPAIRSVPVVVLDAGSDLGVLELPG
jgi:hypothetical protein